MKLNKDTLLMSIIETNFFGQLSHLLEVYPWNNFLQLKSITIFDEILDASNKQFAAKALKQSNIGQTLINLGNKVMFDHQSSRTIRHGYMAVVVKIANTIINAAKDKDFVSEYLDSLGEDWKLFVDGELKRSNETNSKSLGGQQPRPSGSDDDDMDSSTSMESILSRFSNFNTAMSQKANSQHDDDEEDEDDNEDNEHHQEEDDDRDNILKARDSEYQRPGTPIIIPTTVPKVEEPLVKEFADNNFWKVSLAQEKSLDELMAEMEL